MLSDIRVQSQTVAKRKKSYLAFKCERTAGSEAHVVLPFVSIKKNLQIRHHVQVLYLFASNQRQNNKLLQSQTEDMDTRY